MKKADKKVYRRWVVRNKETGKFRGWASNSDPWELAFLYRSKVEANQSRKYGDYEVVPVRVTYEVIGGDYGQKEETNA